MMKTSWKRIAVTGALLIAGAAAWVTTTRAFDWSLTGEKVTRVAVPITVNDAPLSRDTRLTTSFAPIVKKVAPSVVNVFSTKNVRNPYGDQMRPFFDDPMFRRFFGQPFGGNGSRRQPRTFKQQSLGSGVIVTKDGYILTNNHVVDGADEIKVSMGKEKKEYAAKVVGGDPKTDVAVLKIEAHDLPYVTLTDSAKIEVGDVVLAIGNPFGLSQTVTMGIVSATGRGDLGIEPLGAYEDFIQTDAAINPGNSGGALVDTEGRLIGINTAILSRSGGNQGVGFAVPINLAKNVMDQLIKTGKVERGYLGVGIQDLSSGLAKAFNAPNTEGALVTQVSPDSAAEKAGIKNGDVIVGFDGKEVKDANSLKLMAGQTAPGKKVEVKVRRDGKEKTFNLTLKEMPQQELASSDHNNNGSAENSDALDGVTVGDIDASARQQFNLPDDLKGAIITDIDPDSTSYEAGLRQGDVIQEIDHKVVTNADEAVEASKHVKNDQVLVRVWSRGGSHYVVVDDSKKK